MATEGMTIEIGGYQFGRYIEVKIQNFVTKELHTISNDFDISFDFFKSIDEINNASTGSMQIKGISRDTFSKIKSEGGEIQVDCGYINDEISTLFVAVITRMWQTVAEGTLLTNIEFSANVLNFSFVGHEELSAVSMINLPLNSILYRIAKASNAIPVVESFVVPINKQQDFNQFMTTASFNIYIQGDDLRETLRNVMKDFGFVLTTKDYSDGTKEYIFSVTNEGWSNIQQRINSGYVKVNETKKEATETYNVTNQNQKTKEEAVKYLNLFETPESLAKKAVVLTWGSGLKAAEPEYRIATVLETKSLASNETYTNSAIDAINKDSIAREKRKEKDAKRLASGKEVKPRVEKLKYRKVNREYMRVKALLNPQVKPQTNVMLKTPQGYAIYRARNIKYSGNNKSGAWDMDMYCEDSSGKYDTPATPEDIATREVVLENNSESISSVDVNDSLGKDTTYGGESE